VTVVSVRCFIRQKQGKRWQNSRLLNRVYVQNTLNIALCCLCSSSEMSSSRSQCSELVLTVRDYEQVNDLPNVVFFWLSVIFRRWLVRKASGKVCSAAPVPPCKWVCWSPETLEWTLWKDIFVPYSLALSVVYVKFYVYFWHFLARLPELIV